MLAIFCFAPRPPCFSCLVMLAANRARIKLMRGLAASTAGSNAIVFAWCPTPKRFLNSNCSNHPRQHGEAEQIPEATGSTAICNARLWAARLTMWIRGSSLVGRVNYDAKLEALRADKGKGATRSPNHETWVERLQRPRLVMPDAANVSGWVDIITRHG